MHHPAPVARNFKERGIAAVHREGQLTRSLQKREVFRGPGDDDERSAPDVLLDRRSLSFASRRWRQFGRLPPGGVALVACPDAAISRQTDMRSRHFDPTLIQP